MSKCIGREGEYSDHVADDHGLTCTRCFAFDEDAAVSAHIERKRLARGIEALIRDLDDDARAYGEVYTYGMVQGRLRTLLVEAKGARDV